MIIVDYFSFLVFLNIHLIQLCISRTRMSRIMAFFQNFQSHWFSTCSYVVCTTRMESFGDSGERVDPCGWGGQQASWLRQIESYLRDTGMAGLACAWAMDRRRPKEYRRQVDTATRCSGVCPHTWSTWTFLRYWTPPIGNPGGDDALAKATLCGKTVDGQITTSLLWINAIDRKLGGNHRRELLKANRGRLYNNRARQFVVYVIHR